MSPEAIAKQKAGLCYIYMLIWALGLPCLAQPIAGRKYGRSQTCAKAEKGEEYTSARNIYGNFLFNLLRSWNVDGLPL